MAIFSKLKGGKTERFSKLKQIFCKTQGKYLKTQFFGKFCHDGPLFNIVNKVTMTSLLQFYYITLGVLPLHLSLSISVNAKLNNFSTTQRFFSKTQAQNSRIWPKLNFSEIPFPYIAAQTAKKKPVLHEFVNS